MNLALTIDFFLFGRERERERDIASSAIQENESYLCSLLFLERV